MLSDTMMLGGGRKAAYPMENSLLFRGGQYLSRTPSVAGNRKTWTFSAWVRRSAYGINDPLLDASDNEATTLYAIRFTPSDALEAIGYVSGTQYQWYSTAVFRDPTADLHVVVAFDTTQATSGDRIKVYVNGASVAGTMATAPTFNVAYGINNTIIHRIGYAPFGPQWSQGERAEPILVDGAALTPSSFGEADPITLSWRPKKISGLTYGTNGFYLGAPWNPADLGNDYSGNNNDWTPSGFVATDVVTDTPTNVFATLNPLTKSSAMSVVNGNLTATTASGNFETVIATFPVKIPTYWEVKYHEAYVGGSNGVYPGLTDRTLPSNPTQILGYAISGMNSLGFFADQSGGADVRYNGTTVWSDSTTTSVANDVFQFAHDPSSGKLWIARNGAWLNGGDPAAGTGYVAVLPTSIEFFPGTSLVAGPTVDFNFGQTPFAYTPPTGFKPLCTANLPATTGQASGSFTGNADADGPCIYAGAVPQNLTINGNAVVWGTHADKLATGFKLRTASSSYNANGSNSWSATYNRKPTIGTNKVPANAQGNP